MSVHIHREPLTELSRHQDGEERWCFTCRQTRRFDLVVLTPVDALSYYGPAPHIECAACRTWDGDCFPGRQREWSE